MKPYRLVHKGDTLYYFNDLTKEEDEGVVLDITYKPGCVWDTELMVKFVSIHNKGVEKVYAHGGQTESDCFWTEKEELDKYKEAYDNRN